MKKLTFTLLTLGLSLLSFAQLDTQKVEQLDSLIDNLYANNKFMGTLTVYKNGSVLYDRQVGEYHNDEINWEANASSQYRIGSISKMFTTVAVFQLIDEGKLSLETKLSKYYPQVKHADDITIRQMLNHHSGIYSFTNDDGYLDWNQQEHTKAEMLEIITSKKPTFKPGKKALYSNSNFILLGYIIEDIEKDAYANIIKKRITDKLGLKSTQYGTSYKTSSTEVPSFFYINKEWEQSSETHMSVPHGAGAMVSTSIEMSMFIDGLFKGKLIPKNWLDTMVTIEDRYGMGIFKFWYSDTTFAYGHTGGIDGFVSMLTYNPSDSLVVAFSSNGLNYGMNQFSMMVNDIIAGELKKVPDFKTFNITSEEALKCAGKYKSKDLPLKIKVFYENDVLRAQATGQGSFPLSLREDGKYEYSPAGVVMWFEEEKKGKYTTMYLQQGGRVFTYKRKK